MKKRVKIFLISKCKSLNQERNKEYDALMKQFIDSKCKTNISEQEQNDLEEIKAKLLNFNNEFLNTIKIHAGLDIDECSNIQKIIQKYKERREQKCINSLKTNDGVIVKSDDEIRKAIVDNFEETYKEIEMDIVNAETFLSEANVENEMQTESLLGLITNDEIKIAISQLNRGKSPGPDGLPTEFYQTFVNDVADILASAFNEGVKSQMHDSFYQGIISLLYKKGDETDLNNWRQITLTNIEYKILAKVIMNRLSTVLDNIIEKEQTCAIKGRVMWDNLCTLREMISCQDNPGFYIVGFDQKRAFDLISRDYLWCVLKKYGFPIEFIDMIKLLYAKSQVTVKVNGCLTKYINIYKGVKQGCPMSAALYVIAISPLLNKIKNDTRIKGVKVNDTMVKVTAYADDVTVMVRDQRELDIVKEHFRLYEQAAGAQLNHAKTECVWIGEENKSPGLNIEVKNEIKILGIYISNTECVKRNWDRKEKEILEETEKWKNRSTNYKSRIGIVKTFILSKLMFLATVFPPPESSVTKINKMCVKLIWGNNREVTKRELIYKSTEFGGLGAIEIGNKLKIAFCKNITTGILNGAPWVGGMERWKKRRGRARTSVPYHVLVYGDFINKFKHLNINWGMQANKMIHKLINDYVYGGLVYFKGHSQEHSKIVVTYLNSSTLTGELRDIMWLTVNGRLPVRGVVKWSCFVKTTECPMPKCMEKETIGHLLIDCYRSKEVWEKLYHIGLKIPCDRNILYADFNGDEETKKTYWICICVTVFKLWKTRCKMSADNVFIDSNIVFKQIKTELKRRKTIDHKKLKPELKWAGIVL